MNNATSFWGVAGGTGSDITCGAVVSTSAATCNGNGDGQIVANASSVHEGLRFWQHLANAKIIEGSYTGAPGTDASLATPGVNVPASKLPGVSWSVIPAASFVPAPGDTYSFRADYGTGHLLFGGKPWPGNPYTYQPAMVAKDVWSIDKKIDDGKPGMGNVILQNWTSCSNASSNSDLGATYKFSDANPDCAIVFLLNF